MSLGDHSVELRQGFEEGSLILVLVLVVDPLIRGHELRVLLEFICLLLPADFGHLSHVWEPAEEVMELSHHADEFAFHESHGGLC